MRITWSSLFTGAAVLALGCSGGSDTGPSDGGNGGGGGGGAVGTVIIGNLFFESGHNGTRNPAKDTVAVGQAVTWTMSNTGGTDHTVTSNGQPAFASSGTLSGSGTTVSRTFDTPGTYQYHCSFHSNMTGTIVVQ